MAQTGFTPVIPYNSTTESVTPSPSNMVLGELAVNVTDKRLFSKNGSAEVVEIGTNPSNLIVNGATDNGFDKLQVDGGATFSLGLSTAFSDTSSKIYSVPVSTWVPIEIDHRGTTALANGCNYIFQLQTVATASASSAAKYMVYQTAAGTWAARLISASSVGSAGTPQPQLRVNGTAVEISHTHTGGGYTVRVFVEQFLTGNVSLTSPNFFGNDAAIQSIGDRVLLGGATDDGFSSLRATGSITVNGSGQIRQQADSTAGGIAALSIDNAAGTTRWKVARRNAEGGADTGHDLAIWSYTDAGGFKSTVATIFRDTGNVSIANTTDNGVDKLQVNGRTFLSGNVAIGGTSSTSNASLVVASTITGAATSLGIYQSGTAQSDVTNYFGFRNDLNTAATSFTINNAYGFFARANTIGAGSAITNNHGFYVDTTLAVGTNNYGYYSQMSANGTRNWSLYMNGSAPNYMAGSLLLGGLADNGVDKLQVSGSVSISGTDGTTLLTVQNTNSTTFAAVNMVNDANIGIRAVVYGSAYPSGSLFGIGPNGIALHENGATSALAFGSVGVVPVIFGTNNREAMRIAPTTRNVLIGTSTDNGVNKLQVNGSVGFNGNLTLTGTGRRIFADFSNGTFANRTYFQTSTASSATFVGVLPSGASSGSSITVSAQANPASMSYGSISANTTGIAINSAITGGAIQLPLDFQIGNSTKMRLHTTGNLAIGATTDNATDKLQVTGGVLATGRIVSSSASAGIGYATGAGGTVTQATSKSTGVTLNRPSGQITMNNAALAADTAVSFALTNSVIATTDVVNVCISSGATAGAYMVMVDQLSAGSCRISVRNLTAGSLSEAIVINYSIIKGASA